MKIIIAILIVVVIALVGEGLKALTKDLKGDNLGAVIFSMLIALVMLVFNYYLMFLGAYSLLN